MMSIDPGVLERHTLTQEEYDRIVRTLGRAPNETELGLFSVMWSEHCSYKSSKVHLRRLPTKGPRVLQGPGENAGAVDIGDGLAAVFKMESHNHPSFIEPYQGAATGVGGIIRDIFTMGARPIALLDSLRFGPLDQPRPDVARAERRGAEGSPRARAPRGVQAPSQSSGRLRAASAALDEARRAESGDLGRSSKSGVQGSPRVIMEGVVAGIAGYGNSIGIPTIGGEVGFEDCYAGNPLVNVLCLGIAKRDALVKGRATGVGNPVYYVGAGTGRDGIHGATMASAEFDERSAEKRPAVQVGDPFMEKLLLEACLELMKTDALIGVQDMGAAGLTCSTSEMGARGGAGIEIDIALVPQRETGMTPYEIMLSESQERMLLVVTRGREGDVERIFEKWDLHAVKIGHVTDDRMLRVTERGREVARAPTAALVDDAPVYTRPMREPSALAALRRPDRSMLKDAPPVQEAFLALLGDPAIANKRWVYRQYDHMVRTNTIGLAGMGAGVVRVKGTRRALAVSTDGNGRYCYLDPKRGAGLAVAEAARNVACAGAVPIGATNCLNFGSPERPEIMWQFSQVIDGMAEACTALGIPITGGNVSFYNETDGRAVYPTPVVGVVGLIDDADRVLARVFPAPGLDVVLLGENFGELGASEYLKIVHGLVRGVPPSLTLARERALQRLLASLAADGLIRSAHDCSDGGFAIALAECCFDSGGTGTEVDVPRAVRLPADATKDGMGAGTGSTGSVRLPPSHEASADRRSLGGGGQPDLEPDLGPDLALAATLFGESASRAIVAVSSGRLDEVQARAAKAGVPACAIGRTGGSRIRMAVDGARVIDCGVADAETRWATALERHFTTRT